MTASNDISKSIYKEESAINSETPETFGAYSSFKGSPISQGEFQHNLWNIKDEELSGRWDWKSLRKDILKNGVRNTL